MQMDIVPYGIRKKEIFKNGRRQESKTLYGCSKGSVEVRRRQMSCNRRKVLLEDRDPQINLGQTEACVLENNGETASILLDFGVEFHGYVKLFVWSVSPER